MILGFWPEWHQRYRAGQSGRKPGSGASDAAVGRSVSRDESYSRGEVSWFDLAGDAPALALCNRIDGRSESLIQLKVRR